MPAEPSKTAKNRQTEPRWPAVLALFAVGGLELALPRQLAFGPEWLLLALVFALTVPTVLARRSGYHAVNQVLGYTINGVVTAALIWSLALLVHSLPRHTVAPSQLLVVAAALWTSNILVFASWYWRLDAGGPRARDLRDAHTEGAFLFPQMTLTPAMAEPLRAAKSGPGWSPRFIDYLFLAFNTSTAFSPTDVPVLSRWAKGLMMVQASISLITVALLAARAINVI